DFENASTYNSSLLYEGMHNKPYADILKNVRTLNSYCRKSLLRPIFAVIDSDMRHYTFLKAYRKYSCHVNSKSLNNYRSRSHLEKRHVAFGMIFPFLSFQSLLKFLRVVGSPLGWLPAIRRARLVIPLKAGKCLPNE
ncbi:hypothetical protein L9F63_014106, partial [Diploptera punctata]